MSRGMSRGGGGFPIIIAVLGLLILIVVGIFIYLQLRPDTTAIDANVTMAPTQAPTDIPTQVPTEEPTAEPVTLPPTTEEPTADPNSATPTAYVTAPPSTSIGTVWINASALLIHSQANFTSTTVGKIPYGTQVSGDVSGKWMNVSYEGATGYIYLGRDTDGRDMVKYSEAALEALEANDADELDFFDSIISCVADGEYVTIVVKFDYGVFSETNNTGDLAKSDFETNTGAITDVAHTAGNETATIIVHYGPSPAGNSITVTVKAQSVFKTGGIACAEESDSATIS